MPQRAAEPAPAPERHVAKQWCGNTVGTRDSTRLANDVAPAERDTRRPGNAIRAIDPARDLLNRGCADEAHATIDECDDRGARLARCRGEADGQRFRAALETHARTPYRAEVAHERRVVRRLRRREHADQRNVCELGEAQRVETVAQA